MAKKKVAKKKVAKKPAKKKVAKKKVAKKKVAKKPAKKKVAKKKRKVSLSSAFMKPMQISDALAKVVGSKPIPRTEVTKKLWAYIKKNKLQDKINKRNINADDNLRVVFGGKRQVSMFEMTKLVNKHLS
jgi:upstream activation factor subunit UAF30